MTTKRNGGLRKAVPVALGLAFALVLAGCDNGSTNGGNVNLVVCTLHIDGEQMYEEPLLAGFYPTWERFDEPRTVAFGGATGTIDNHGRLNFEIGTPDNLGNIRDVLNAKVVDARMRGGEMLRLSDWDNIRISNVNARAAWLSLETDEGEAIVRDFFEFGSPAFHGVRHIFVNNYVTISAAGNERSHSEGGEENCQPYNCGHAHYPCGNCITEIEFFEDTWVAFSIDLKPGWNVLGFTYDHSFTVAGGGGGGGGGGTFSPGGRLLPFTSITTDFRTFTVLTDDHDGARWLVDIGRGSGCTGCCWGGWEDD